MKVKAVVLLFTALNSFMCFSEEGTRTRVVDRDRPHIGVESKIKVINVKGQQELVSKTDRQGYVKVDYVCQELEVAVFLPKDDSYYSERVECPININPIKLTSIVYSKNLLVNANKKISENNFGAAALALNEAAARYKKSDAIKANEIEKRAFNATGFLLKVESSARYDPIQDKFVMSQELKEAVTKYQNETGLMISGKLNYLTLKSFSNTSLSTMLFSIPEK